jgi:lipopolysaccharide transport system ATP-binding protein
MSAIAIKVEGVGKQYILGERQPYLTLRESIMRTVRGAFGRAPHDEERKFWAVRDLSLEVPAGQIIGVVGRNGAGKSTLLKILSRITAPTEGRATINGRVGALLEVGVGFHPELTGRENIFLNGAILGMRRAEIKRKFDEIVAFAEIERFLDTPVKRYSSGMYVRLAFSVAAHLEPEILLVDEVLAVGDTAFQKKCIGKMGTVAREGRTILFVSHNMLAVTTLCQRAVLVEGGRVVADGSANDVVDRYLKVMNATATMSLDDRTDRKGDQSLHFTGFELRDGQNRPQPYASSGQDLILAFPYRARAGADLKGVKVSVSLHGKFDENLFCAWTANTNQDFESLPSHGTICCRLPRFPVQPGTYTFNLFCTVREEIADWIANAGTNVTEPGDFYGTGKLPPPEQGPFLVENSWFSE